MLPLISTTNLSKTYQMGKVKIKALQNINLTVNQGESLSVTGPSGSGKSTLMHLLGLLDHPSSGEIKLQGQPTNQLSEIQLAHLRNRQIGFVFQSFNLLRRTPALAQVELPLIYAGVPPSQRHQKAKQALDKVGLVDRLDHLPSQLSGGQQQRVAIARALVNRPSLILADEPTGNLDSQSGKEIMKLFTALNRQGHTIIIVTHEPEIAAYTQRTIKVLDGHIVKN